MLAGVRSESVYWTPIQKAHELKNQPPAPDGLGDSQIVLLPCGLNRSVKRLRVESECVRKDLLHDIILTWSTTTGSKVVIPTESDYVITCTRLRTLYDFCNETSRSACLMLPFCLFYLTAARGSE